MTCTIIFRSVSSNYPLLLYLCTINFNSNWLLQWSLLQSNKDNLLDYGLCFINWVSDCLLLQYVRYDSKCHENGFCLGYKVHLFFSSAIVNQPLHLHILQQRNHRQANVYGIPQLYCIFLFTFLPDNPLSCDCIYKGMWYISQISKCKGSLRKSGEDCYIFNL